MPLSLLYRVHTLERLALSELFTDLQKRSVRYAHYAHPDALREDVELALDDVFVAAVKKIEGGHRFDTMENLRSYVLVGMCNQLRNQYRNQCQRDKRLREYSSYYDNLCYTDYDGYYSNTDPEQIAMLMKSLPEKCQRVVRAMYFDGMYPSELARERGVSKQAIFNLHRVAMRLLKERMTPPGAN